MHLRGHNGRRRVRAHSPSVGALVAVLQALVVLAGGQRQDIFAVTQHDETGFFAL